MTYRAELSGRALKQIHGLPGPAFGSLIEAMAEVIDYPDDPLRTFPTSDPYVRRVEFGDAGLITYLINDGASVVIILDITWARLAIPPPSAGRSEIRILLVFDPWRSVVLLVAGDKSGQWDKWYRTAIPRAEQLYDDYLAERGKEMGL